MTDQPNFDCDKCSSREFYDTCSNCRPIKNLYLRCYNSHKCEYQQESPLPISVNNMSNRSSSITSDKLHVLPTHKQNQQLKTKDSPQPFNFLTKPTLPTHNPVSVKPTSSTTFHSYTSIRNVPAYKSTPKYSISHVSVRPTYMTSSRPHAPTSRSHAPSPSFTEPPKKSFPNLGLQTILRVSSVNPQNHHLQPSLPFSARKLKEFYLPTNIIIIIQTNHLSFNT